MENKATATWMETKFQNNRLFITWIDWVLELITCSWYCFLTIQQESRSNKRKLIGSMLKTSFISRKVSLKSRICRKRRRRCVSKQKLCLNKNKKCLENYKTHLSKARNNENAQLRTYKNKKLR
jgi:hypothetical protein